LIEINDAILSLSNLKYIRNTFTTWVAKVGTKLLYDEMKLMPEQEKLHYTKMLIIFSTAKLQAQWSAPGEAHP
jgi:hypothetical protein